MDNISLKKPCNISPGIASFGKMPICDDLSKLDADIAIVGAPCDIGIQGRSGARLGPHAIRLQSARTMGRGRGSYDFETDEYYFHPDRWKIVDCGDADYIPGDLEGTFDNISYAVREITRHHAMPVVMGGDHSITIPVARGLDEVGEFHVIHLDSHLDWTSNVGGQIHSNGSPCRYMASLPYVKTMTHLGIHGRGSSGPSDFEDARAHGDTILTPKEIRALGVDGVLEKIPKAGQYFVTIDIDVYDYTIAPGTGSPTFGAMFYEEVSELLRGIAGLGRIVAFDLVEVAPQYDSNGSVTAALAARTIADFLGYITKRIEKLEKPQ